MKYGFYGEDSLAVKPISAEYEAITDQRVLYALLSEVWCAETCAPRLRAEWTPANKTLGQCSVTSFLVQDIFGGEVYGVPLTGGGFHCFNVVGASTFDLTSEQFGGEALCYDTTHPQSREEHFSDPDKYARYLLLKERLQAKSLKTK